jgi:hypothetical protein
MGRDGIRQQIMKLGLSELGYDYCFFASTTYRFWSMKSRVIEKVSTCFQGKVILPTSIKQGSKQK